MVLERLYPLQLIERNPFFAFLLGLGYSIIGIGTAVILFPEDPTLIAVAFISIMVIPTLNQLLRQEEAVESEKDESNLITFFRDHKDMFKIYMLLFLGMLLGFSLFSIVLPTMATNYIFNNQINILYGQLGRKTGHAIISSGLFKTIFYNNLNVLLLCLVTAFIFGDGAIILITWNASVWGTIFGVMAKSAAFNIGKSPFYLFITVLLIVFPHMMLEAFSYICSATSGAVISRGLAWEQFMSDRFKRMLKNTIILLIFSIIVLVIAVTIETYVLGNVTTYRTIIRQAFG